MNKYVCVLEDKYGIKNKGEVVQNVIVISNSEEELIEQLSEHWNILSITYVGTPNSPLSLP